jgi:hypothetical protein
MKDKLMTVAIALALVILLARVFEKPLLAQISAALTLTENVDEPGRNPFQLTASGPDYLGEQTTTFTVPVGKRYVIESYSVGCTLPAAQSMTSVLISSTVAGQTATMYAPAFVRWGNSEERAWGATGISRLYADPGTTISMSITTAAVTPNSGCTYSVVGYSVSLYTLKKPDPFPGQ